MNIITKAALAAFATIVAVPAVAATTPLTFNTTGSDSSLYGTLGNSKIFSTVVGGVTYSLRASAWSLNGGGAITAAHLGVYGGGLGVTNANEGTGGNNQHTIDNYDGVDFVTLQFDRAVTLTSATMNAYNLFGNWAADTDASVGHATTSQAWNGALNITDPTLLSALSSSLVSQAGTSSSGSRSVNSAAASGNLWLVSADLFGVDSTYDAFKLGSVSATVTPAQTAPVPEPATWAMMLAGFGAVGVSMRRRGERTFAQAV